MWPIVLAALLSCADLCGPQAVAHYADLFEKGGFGRLPRERAAFLVRGESGELSLVPWPNSDYARATYRGPIPRATIAIVHTHPAAHPRPSVHDRHEAERLGLPVVVIAPTAVTLIRTDGTSWTIASGRAWSRVK